MPLVIGEEVEGAEIEVEVGVGVKARVKAKVKVRVSTLLQAPQLLPPNQPRLSQQPLNQKLL